ncbi:pilus assembly protein N-terminal domain-containing protein [Microvirga yunnanensis]|uniref:pilus assembly protein N-terminal domain-containing protein n=1 Tax=Microvirga yunnanensis TaxID=2953740 RepID=UPI0021C574E2|nr:pilus assembly protein N-terminal domain-containing protein [Microvirga sp. HBU65207]
MRTILRSAVVAVALARLAVAPDPAFADEQSKRLRSIPNVAATQVRRVAEARVVARQMEMVEVVLDLAKILKLNEPARTIVIGNPAVLDATINDERTLVLTGKTLGTTNMIVLDGDGDEVTNLMINVVQGSHIVTVHRGNQKETYNCIGACRPTVAVGTGVIATPDATTTGSVRR